MANKYLAREDAPFETDVWQKLDGAMVQAAKSQLIGRRLLEVEGPYGLGVQAIPLPDPDEPGESGLIVGGMLPLAWLYQDFTLGLRDLAAYERDHLNLDVRPVADAAIKVARMEDDLIFNGAEGMDGLMTVEEANRLELSSWDEVGTAANDLVQAITKLDQAGFHGPYTLALAPQRYNLLFRLYGQRHHTEMEHLQQMVTEGIYKAPLLEEGGILISTGRHFASIILGQDMTVGFIGPVGTRMEMSVSESLTLRIRRPDAFCILE